MSVHVCCACEHVSIYGSIGSEYVHAWEYVRVGAVCVSVCERA